ncbi:MAG: hypothetical protein L0Y72_13870 [Gemmataceae bacterium]|nr:hypothetical protein [Gemmataceae bacterium]MCI0740129.1 hypothetical protein [Gemmataceae bacterium]
MQSVSWIALFRRVPKKLHELLTVTTVTGIEIHVQTLLRLDEDVMIMRGRLGGTNEAGRIMMVPYDYITYAGFTKKMTEADVLGIFGKGEEWPGADDQTTNENAQMDTDDDEDDDRAGDSDEDEEEAAAEGATVELRSYPASPSGLASAAGPPLSLKDKVKPSKTALLERLRARLDKPVK